MQAIGRVQWAPDRGYRVGRGRPRGAVRCTRGYSLSSQRTNAAGERADRAGRRDIEPQVVPSGLSSPMECDRPRTQRRQGRAQVRPRTGRLDPTKQLALEHERHQKVAVAVVVEEHGELVAVVTLHSALAPALAADPLADRERLGAGGSAVAVSSLSQFPQGPG